MTKFAENRQWIFYIPEGIMSFFKMYTDGKKRNEGGCSFANKISANCNCRCNTAFLRDADKIEHITATYAEKLFQKLDCGRKPCIFSAKIITVYACVKSTQRNTGRKNPYQMCCLWLFQDLYCPEICMTVKKPGKQQRDSDRKCSSCNKVICSMVSGNFLCFF